MGFSSYLHYFPEKGQNETRSITLMRPEGDLEPNTYTFIELYCTDLNCDCRRAMIQVYDEQNNLRATLCYGWENREFYINWMGDEEGLEDVPGVNVYSLQPQGQGYLDLEKKLKWIMQVDPAYAKRIQSHYYEFKTKIDSEDPKGHRDQGTVRVTKTGRNDACPCGSGKKFKRCCQQTAVPTV